MRQENVASISSALVDFEEFYIMAKPLDLDEFIPVKIISEINNENLFKVLQKEFKYFKKAKR